MTWRIRRAVIDESDAVAALYRRVADAEWSFLVAHTPEEDRAFFRSQVFGRCVIWVAEEAGTLIGFCAVRRGWIDHLYVQGEHHGKGVGRALLARALHSGLRVQLWTFQVNTRSRDFYARQGFHPVRLTDGSDNEEKEPDVLLRWTSPAGR